MKNEKENKVSCDETGKKASLENGFPYSDGWVYLHKVGFKTIADKRVSYHDKHFSSQKAAIAWLEKNLKG